MFSIHIFFVILATVILIIFAEFQKLRKITWILLIGCAGYIFLIITPDFTDFGNKTESEQLDSDSISNDSLNISTILKVDSSEFRSTIDEPKIMTTKLIVDDKNILQADLRINSIAMATAIIDREPEGSATNFSTDIGQLFCHTSVYNQANNNKIFHNWRLNGKVFFSHSIDLGKSYAWRCWSQITVRPQMAGDWSVIVTDSLGNLLESIEFTIE